MKKIICISLIICVYLSGCIGSSRKPVVADGNSVLDRYSLPAVERASVKPAEGSIYNPSTSTDLYRDSRARRVGDLVLVKIVESSSGTKKASTKTSRNSSITGDLTAMFGIEKWFAGKNSNFTAGSKSLQAGLQNSFDGSGETKRDSTVTATISARVIDVTMDGNLIIRGYREVRVNNENQHIILSGMVRPVDIAKDNSVTSTLIADARIEYSGTGDINAKQEPGWLAKSLEVIWPF
jgi:flagellar L-ring protein FlgH